MKKMKFYIKQMMMFAIVSATAFTIACDALNGDDDPVVTEDPVASFQFEVDATDWAKVTFVNFSQNATAYSWDFGDGSAVSTEENPVYTYAEGGTYSVVLTASNADGASSTKSETLTITDPVAAGGLLTNKKWIVQREGTVLYVGPSQTAYDGGWWSFSQHATRPCVFDDEYTFTSEGAFLKETGGTFYMDSRANGGWNDGAAGGEGCVDETTPDAFKDSETGADYSALANGGSYTYVYDATASTLTITGSGAYIALPKVTDGGDLGVTGSLPGQITFDVVKLVEGPVADSLHLFTKGGFWTYKLVSYHNDSDIPALAELDPVDVTLSVDMSDYSGSFTNVYISGEFNSWSGDANAMTDANSDGVYEVTLTGLIANSDYQYKFSLDNWAVSDSFTADDACAITTDNTNYNRLLSTGTANFTVPTVCFNMCTSCGGDAFGGAADLVGNWKLAPVAGATGVGPTQGDTGWWANDEASVTGARACMFDDVWTFDAAGNFSYQMDGSTFLEAWQGAAPDGCGTPVAPFDGTGTYTFTADATSITLNGEGAFIGLPKVNNAGEISNGAAVQSSITYMVTEYTAGAALTLDIEAGSGVWWRFKLVKN